MSVFRKGSSQIKKCDFKHIRHILKDYHYKEDAMGGGISVCFAMFTNGKMVGGSVLGKPRHEGKYESCIDIRRMALIDESPKNSESWFLSQIIKWVASNTDYNYVLSYSDETVGHSGTIYKAANFENIGITSPTKTVNWNGRTYHPRSISIDRPYSYELRAAIEKGEAEVVTGKPKNIWLYTISKKLKRKKFNVIDITNQLSLFEIN